MENLSGLMFSPSKDQKISETYLLRYLLYEIKQLRILEGKLYKIDGGEYNPNVRSNIDQELSYRHEEFKKKLDDFKNNNEIDKHAVYLADIAFINYVTQHNIIPHLYSIDEWTYWCDVFDMFNDINTQMFYKKQKENKKEDKEQEIEKNSEKRDRKEDYKEYNNNKRIKYN